MRAVTPRRGFTLLEVILALSVGVLLLGGLYVAVEDQHRSTRARRTVVEQATLIRSLLARVDADVGSAATLIDPERFRAPPSGGSSGSSGGQSGSSGSTQSGTTAATGSGTTGGTTSSSSSAGSSGTSTSSSVATDAVSLPLSVQGDSTTLHLYIARFPREAFPTDPNAAPQLASDIRRVSWWLSGGGLARQEVSVSTSQDALDNLPPGLPDEDSHVLAPEVKSVQFQYFDGTSWQDSWDCTTMGADGVTPIGPPLAVAIVLDVANQPDGVRDDEEPPTKRYRHVVACQTANGTTAQQQPQQNGTGGTGQ
jgi:prepilin-type N-terminal cleavage/methylation domain-containing protein